MISYSSQQQQQQGGGQQQQQQSVIVPQQQHGVIIHSSSARGNGVREGLPASGTLVLGILTIICGSLAVLFNIIGLAISAEGSRSGQGFWCGGWFIITGVLGVVSGKTKKTGPIVAMMVVAIISCVLSIGILIQASIGMAIDNSPGHNWWSTHYTTHRGGKVATNALLLTTGILGFFFCLVLSILACVGVCNSSGSRGHVIAPQPVFNGPQAIVMTSQGGQGGSSYPPNQQPMTYPQNYAQNPQQNPQFYAQGPPAYSTQYTQPIAGPPTYTSTPSQPNPPGYTAPPSAQLPAEVKY